ncbi:MFS transporter, partial [Mycolicibacterium austroafricanum]
AFDPDDELYWADGEDEYVEYEVPWDDGAEPRRPAQEADTVDAAADTDVLDPVTEPMHDGGGYPAPESAPRRDHADPTSHPDREWLSILDQLLDPPKPSDDQTGQGRNGFHVTPSEDGRGASRGRHSRD